MPTIVPSRLIAYIDRCFHVIGVPVAWSPTVDSSHVGMIATIASLVRSIPGDHLVYLEQARAASCCGHSRSEPCANEVGVTHERATP